MPQRRIQVFVADASLFQEAKIRELLYSWLNEAEKERYRRFRFDSLRLTFLVSRGMLRFLLGYYTATLPREVRFRFSETGKPSPDPPGNIAFNLSHSGSYIALGMGEAEEMGVDIERYDRTVSSAENLAEACLAADEYKQFLSLRENNAADLPHRYFTKLWVLKEAYLKALGIGLGKSLKSISFQLRPDGSILSHDQEMKKELRQQWQPRLYTTFDAFPLAVVWKSNGQPSDPIREVGIYCPGQESPGCPFSWLQKTVQ